MIEVIVESTEKMVENLPETFLYFSKVPLRSHFGLTGFWWLIFTESHIIAPIDDKPTPLDKVNFNGTTSMNVDILGWLFADRGKI